MDLEINLASSIDELLEERGILAALFLPGEAIGAIPNLSRVVKINSEPGDSYPDGTEGIVIASHNAAHIPGVPHPFGYFVLFDPRPNVPTFIAGNRIREHA